MRGPSRGPRRGAVQIYKYTNYLFLYLIISNGILMSYYDFQPIMIGIIISQILTFMDFMCIINYTIPPITSYTIGLFIYNLIVIIMYTMYSITAIIIELRQSNINIYKIWVFINNFMYLFIVFSQVKLFQIFENNILPLTSISNINSHSEDQSHTHDQNNDCSCNCEIKFPTISSYICCLSNKPNSDIESPNCNKCPICQEYINPTFCNNIKTGKNCKCQYHTKCLNEYKRHSPICALCKKNFK